MLHLLKLAGTGALSLLGILLFVAFYVAFNAGMGMVCEWAGTTPAPLRWAVSHIAMCGFPYMMTTRDTPKQQPGETVQHVMAALNWHNKAAEITNRTNAQGLDVHSVSNEDYAAVLDYNQKTLSEAELADIANMNQWLGGFGDHWRDEFILGEKAVIAGLKGNGSARAQAGVALMSKFGDWYEEHLDAIRSN